jgi:hypothetical protein
MYCLGINLTSYDLASSILIRIKKGSCLVLGSLRNGVIFSPGKPIRLNVDWVNQHLMERPHSVRSRLLAQYMDDLVTNYDDEENGNDNNGLDLLSFVSNHDVVNIFTWEKELFRIIDDELVPMLKDKNLIKETLRCTEENESNFVPIPIRQ